MDDRGIAPGTEWEFTMAADPSTDGDQYGPGGGGGGGGCLGCLSGCGTGLMGIALLIPAIFLLILFFAFAGSCSAS